ncbi:MAG: tRNA (N(6)-L-threonylcarbamoyladenosine(37)-C(2))-methylthiotransferase MtaB [Thermodesulfobacteriota bacterium]|nr:tRNA (N(6)-L-threonylcarbamoyladenosine(37)-C(2))-methylthiotransferase MtaB [Thermodesulfobacteriota bacterium]
MKTTACVITLGCKANQFESAAMEQLLIQDGYRLCPFEEGAQLVIVNTCTVTSATDAQSRKLVRRAHRFNPECRIVVTGCYAQVQPQELADIPGVEFVIGNIEKQHLIALLNGRGAKVQVGDIATSTSCPNLKIASFFEHSRAFVQIQSGCDAFCSYCIIPFARGRSRSVAVPDVVAQIQALVENGYHEVVLTGIHIGNYGRDLGAEFSLDRLVQTILEQTTLHRLRLGSVEPQELTSDLIDVVASSSRVCPHLHIPLQSGSDEVLKRMNRHYTANQFCACLQKIQAVMPDISIGIDLIVGFPGETQAEHDETMALVSLLPIHYLHVFPYSKRPGTTAEKMPNQVEPSMAKMRAKQLRQFAQTKKRDYINRFVGKRVEVMVEKRSTGQSWQGLSAEYVAVKIKSDQNLAQYVGRPIGVDIYAADGDCLLAMVSK